MKFKDFFVKINSVAAKQRDGRIFMRILLVEDEIAMAEALQYILEKSGFQVDIAYDGISGEDYACSNIYDVIILDRMLPGKEGVDILKCIRREQINTPTMFLTARDSIDDRVEGLDAGADDYLIKPFSNKEFLARVKALARRSENILMDSEVSFSGTSLYVNKCIYKINNTEIALTKTEAQLLELFIRNKEQVLSKEIILDRIWGFDKDVEPANVELYIFYLRKKINFKQANLELKTIRGVGYSLTEVQR